MWTIISGNLLRHILENIIVEECGLWPDPPTRMQRQNIAKFPLFICFLPNKGTHYILRTGQLEHRRNAHGAIIKRVSNLLVNRSQMALCQVGGALVVVGRVGGRP